MIFAPNNQEGNGALNQLLTVVRAFGNYLATAMDINGRQRVNVETGVITASIASAQTLATVTTVATLQTTGAANYSNNDMIPSLMNMNAFNIRSRITVS